MVGEESALVKAPSDQGGKMHKAGPFPSPVLISALSPPHTGRVPEPPRPPRPERGISTADGAPTRSGRGAPSGPHRTPATRASPRSSLSLRAAPGARPPVPPATGAAAGQNQRGSRLLRRVGAAGGGAAPCAGRSPTPQPPQHSPGPRSAAPAPLRCRSGPARAAAAAFCSRSAASPAHRATAAAAAHWPPPLPRARCLSARRAPIGRRRWGAAARPCGSRSSSAIAPPPAEPTAVTPHAGPATADVTGGDDVSRPTAQRYRWRERGSFASAGTVAAGASGARWYPWGSGGTTRTGLPVPPEAPGALLRFLAAFQNATVLTLPGTPHPKWLFPGIPGP